MADSFKGLWFLVSGKRYAGKDTVADMIATIMSQKSERLSFAAAVKQECAKEHGLDYKRLMTDTPYKEQHRQLLIDHGARMRESDPNYWIKATVASANTAPDYSHIVSDWRFPNERSTLQEITDKRVVCIRVVAADWARSLRGWTPSAVDSDQSECALDGNNNVITVTNNGSRAELMDAVTRVCLGNGILDTVVCSVFNTYGQSDILCELVRVIVHKSDYRRQLRELNHMVDVLQHRYMYSHVIDHEDYKASQLLLHGRMQVVVDQISAIDTFIEMMLKANVQHTVVSTFMYGLEKFDGWLL